MCTCGSNWPCAHARNDNTTFNFLALPGEIRNRIYHHLLTPPVNDQARGTNDIILISPLGNEGESMTPRSLPHSIFAVNRRVREEARSLYYSLNTKFDLVLTSEAVGIPQEWYKQKHRQWVRLLGDDAAAHITALGLWWGLYVDGDKLSMKPPPNGSLESRYHLRMGWRLDTTPPKASVSLLDNPAPSRRGSVIVGPRQRLTIRILQQIVTEVKCIMDAKLQGLYGSAHCGRYRCCDLVSIIDAFFDTIQCCFSDNKRDKYWLRRREGAVMTQD
jgi:hypothetical protein